MIKTKYSASTFWHCLCPEFHCAAFQNNEHLNPAFTKKESNNVQEDIKYIH